MTNNEVQHRLSLSSQSRKYERKQKVFLVIQILKSILGVKSKNCSLSFFSIDVDDGNSATHLVQNQSLLCCFSKHITSAENPNNFTI